LRKISAPRAWRAASVGLSEATEPQPSRMSWSSMTMYVGVLASTRRTTSRDQFERYFSAIARRREAGSESK